MAGDIHYTMTPEEEEFFNTGKMPDAMKTEAAAAAAAVAVVEEPEAPIIDPVIEEPKQQPTATDPNEFLERQLAASQAQTAEMQAKLKQMQDQLAAINKPQAPDMETDPVGYLTFQIKEMQDAIKAMTTSTAQTAEQQQQDQFAKEFKQAVNNGIAEFKKSHDDYDAAYKHLRTTRESDLFEAGYTKAEVAQTLDRDEFNLALRAVQVGKNPAEVAYAMAKRAGYTPGTPQTPNVKIDQIRKGLEASGGVKTTTAKQSDFSIEGLKSASDADLNDLVQNNWDKLSGQKGNSIF